jgi:hypothetical protein
MTPVQSRDTYDASVGSKRTLKEAQAAVGRHATLPLTGRIVDAGESSEGVYVKFELDERWGFPHPFSFVMDLDPFELGGRSVSVPESVPLLAGVLADLAQAPALSPISTVKVIELPCCGFRFDADAIDSSQDGPSQVYWPPRWTCPQCERTFTPDLTGRGLDEMPEVSR